MSRNRSSRRAFLGHSGSMLASGLLLGGPTSVQAIGQRPRPRAGAVFALTNTVMGNAVAVFARSADGILTPTELVYTGGMGLGDGPDAEGLQSQGALALGPGNRFLYAVDGGSDSLAVFAVAPWGLALIQRVRSGGHVPISLTVHGNTLYALNYDRQAMAARGSITGFRVGGDGRLVPLAGSARPLSGPGTNPGQVAFSPDGRLLAVTEKATNQLLTYRVDGFGYATGPRAFPSGSDFPFSLAFGPGGLLVVADDFEDIPHRGAASSFRASGDGTLTHLSGPVANLQSGTCWVVVTPDGRFAIVANTNSSVLTTYVIDARGGLSRLDANGFTAFTGGFKPRDMALGGDGAYLYALNSASGSIACFNVLSDGHLGPIELIGGLPFPGSNGLAAY